MHALPVLAALRSAYPDAHIAWLVNRTFAPLLAGNPLLNEVIEFDRRRYGRMWWNLRANLAFWRFVAEIRSRRFDLVIDLQGLIRSGLLAWFSGARRRVGLATAREGAWVFYNQRVRPDADVEHAVDKNLALVRAIGVKAETPEFPLGLQDQERSAARRILAKSAGREIEHFTAVMPGARWDSKRWSTEKLAALIDRMHEAGLPHCVLLGGPDDHELAAEIVSRCRTPVVDLIGQTSLRELTALIDLADQVVCHDSGPMHIAAALGKPTVAVFGPTNPRRTGPYSPAARVVTHEIDCAPCYRRECPLGHHDCMQKLAADKVFEAVRAGRSEAPEVREVRQKN